MNKNERYYQAYLEHNKISRRGLLHSLLKSVKENRNGILTEGNNGRPPFSASRHLFYDLCDGCGQCVSICPYGLLQLSQGKPIISIDFSSCDFCGLCADNCHTNVLNKVFKADTYLRPTINNDLCINNTCDECLICRDTCPQKAISTDLDIDYDKCNGCGECKINCFVSAITLDAQQAV